MSIFNHKTATSNFTSPDLKFYYHTILPEESGTIFSVNGGSGPILGRSPHGVIIYVLPPIEEFGNGMTFTFKAEGWIEYNIYAHQGLAPIDTNPYTNELTLKGYRSNDYYSNGATSGSWGSGTGQDQFCSFYYAPADNDGAGYSNATYRFTSARRPGDDDRGGIWLISQDEAGMFIYPYYWTPFTRFDWYNVNQRFPARAAMVDAVVDRDITGHINGRNPKRLTYYTMSDPQQAIITKTSDYTLSENETGSVVTNTSATDPVEFVLPPASLGLEYFFLQKTANNVGNIHIRAAEGDQIKCWEKNRGNHTAQEIYYYAVNANIQLLANNNNEWHFIHQIPEWYAFRSSFPDRYQTTVHVPGVPGDMVSARDVLETEDGIFFTTSGNHTVCTFTLPDAYGGLEYGFQVGTSVSSGIFQVNVSGQQGEKLWAPDVLSGYDQMSSDVYLNTIRFKAVDTTGWYVISSGVTWSGV